MKTYIFPLDVISGIKLTTLTRLLVDAKSNLILISVPVYAAPAKGIRDLVTAPLVSTIVVE